jgi:hypothetical protein
MTRYMLYGTITVRMKSIPRQGVASTFITMSDVRDEIDFEMLGADPHTVQTAVFYRGINEWTHGYGFPEPQNGYISDYHDYTFNWSVQTQALIQFIRGPPTDRSRRTERNEVDPLPHVLRPSYVHVIFQDAGQARMVGGHYRLPNTESGDVCVAHDARWQTLGKSLTHSRSYSRLLDMTHLFRVVVSAVCCPVPRHCQYSADGRVGRWL